MVQTIRYGNGIIHTYAILNFTMIKKKLVRKILSVLAVSIIFGIVYFLLQSQFDSFVTDSSIVKNFLTLKENSSLHKILFSIMLLIASILGFYYEVSLPKFFQYLIPSFFLIYIVKRLTSVNSPFQEFLGFTTYVDLLLLFLFYFTFWEDAKKIIKSKKESEKPTKEAVFFEDIELYAQGNKPDLKHFTPYAETIVKRILASTFTKAFAIGITGKWGTGKTSFIHLLEKALIEVNGSRKPIFIHFNPWASSDSSQLIPNFFEALTEALNEENIFIKNEITSYLEKISQVEVGILGESLKPVFNLFSSPNSLETIKSRISDKIGNQDRKVIIVIDDLDRLNKQELYEVLKLIRNTANFRNICYLVAYDKDYVLSFLQHDYEFDFGKYLEKIFSFEVNLPAYNKSVLVEKLRTNLSTLLETIEDEKNKQHLNEKIKNISEKTVAFEALDTIRDITRLSNALSTNLLPLLGEVDVIDFINLEILRMKYHSVYEILKNDQYKLLQNTRIDGNNRLSLKNDFSEILGENFSPISLLVLDKLFRFKESKSPIKANRPIFLEIIVPNRYFLYFTYSVTIDDFYYNKFIESIADETVFKAFIEKCVKEKKQSALKYYMTEISSFDNREVYKNYITGLIFFYSIRNQIKPYYTAEDAIFFDYGLVNNKLFLMRYVLEKVEIENFLNELFSVKLGIFTDENYVKLRVLIYIFEFNQFSEDTPIKREFAINILNQNLKHFLQCSFSSHYDTYNIFVKVKEINQRYENPPFNFEEYLTLIKHKFKDNPKEQFKLSLQKGENDNSYGLKSEISWFFNKSFDDFYTFLKNEIDEEIQKEAYFKSYLDFLNENIRFVSENEGKISYNLPFNISVFDDPTDSN